MVGTAARRLTARGDEVGGPLAAQDGDRTLGGQLRHAPARGPRRAPDVRQQHRVRGGEQTRVHLGLALVDVDAGGEDRAVLERDGQRLLVDDRTARRVHQHRRRLHEREPAGVDQPARPVVQGNVERDEVDAW